MLDDGERTAAEQELKLIDLPDEVASTAAAKREVAQVQQRPEYHEARVQASKVRKARREAKQLEALPDMYYAKQKVVEGSKRARKPSTRALLGAEVGAVSCVHCSCKPVSRKV